MYTFYLLNEFTVNRYLDDLAESRPYSVVGPAQVEAFIRRREGGNGQAAVGRHVHVASALVEWHKVGRFVV